MTSSAVPAAQKARILAEALPFIRAFHASTLIIRFGGGAMVDPALKEAFARDVALLRLVGMKPIIVHGGGWRIDQLLQTMGIEIRKHRGMRVIDEPTLNVIEMVLGEINQELVGLINRFGAKAVGLNGQDGRFIHARRMTLPRDDGAGRGARSRSRRRCRAHRSGCRSPSRLARLHSGHHADRRRRRRHRLSHQFRHRRGTARAHAARREARPHDERARGRRSRRQAHLRAHRERRRGTAARRQRLEPTCSRA